MNEAAFLPGAAWPLLLYGGLVFVLAALIIGLSHVLGQRHQERETGDPFESGVSTTGPARFRFPVPFYLLAMFFVIFDIESAFVFAWAVALREAGWAGYAALVVFLLTFLLMIFYLARTGALDFVKRPGRSAAPRRPSAGEPGGRP